MKIIQRTREEVLKLWVAALRSGKYKQTDGVLRDGEAFCCLGVLCDLAKKDGGPSWGKKESDWDAHEYMGEEDLLPEPIAKFMRLPEKQQQTLTMKNDSGASFLKIADYIEERYIK